MMTLREKSSMSSLKPGGAIVGTYFKKDNIIILDKVKDLIKRNKKL